MHVKTKRSKHFTDSVVNTVEKLKQEKNTGAKFPLWPTVTAEIRKLFPDEYITTEVVRWVYRTRKDNEYTKDTTQVKAIAAGTESLEQRLLKKINDKRTVVSLADLLDVTIDDILLAATKLNIAGYTGVNVWSEGGTLFIKNSKKTKNMTLEHDHTKHWENAREIVIGIVSDNHMGSEFSAEEELENFYDLAKARGITRIYHAGDLTEGYKQSRMHTFLHNKAIGFTDQLDYTVKHYPYRPGITTSVIAGNHDLFFMEEGLANIVKAVADRRADIEYLGDEFARVWLTPKVDMTLYHPNDGSSGNVFTKLQSFVERAGEKLSKLNIIGHYHKTGWIDFKDVYVMYPGSFQRQSKWMNIKNLRSELGALILTLKVDQDGELLSLVVEHINYNKYYKNT